MRRGEYTEIPNVDEHHEQHENTEAAHPARPRRSLRGSKRKSTKLLDLGHISPESLYPQASSFEEAELLTLLDEIMDSPRSNFRVPHIHEDSVTTITHSYCIAIIIPTFFASLLFGLALYVGTGEAPPLLEAFFPYITALLLFLTTARSIDARIMDQSAFVFETVHHCHDKLTQMIDTNVASVETKVSRVVECLNPVTTAISQKLRVLPPLSQLQLYDGDLELPGLPAAAEFQAPLKAMKLRAERTKVGIRIRTLVPPYLRSSEAYRCRRVVPILVVCGLFQMAGVWFLQHLMTREAGTEEESGGGEIEGGDDYGSERYLRGAASPLDQSVVENHLNFGLHWLSEHLKELISLNPMIDDAWSNILVVLASYFLALLQIWFVYTCFTHVGVSEETNEVLDDLSLEAELIAREEGFVNRVELILGYYMSDIKERLLATIDMVRRIIAAKRKWEQQKVREQRKAAVSRSNEEEEDLSATMRSGTSSRVRNVVKKARGLKGSKKKSSKNGF